MAQRERKFLVLKFRGKKFTVIDVYFNVAFLPPREFVEGKRGIVDQTVAECDGASMVSSCGF